MTLKPFTGLCGLAATVILDPNTRLVVVAEDEPTLERAVNIILAGQGEFIPDRCKPCILISPEALTPCNS